MCACIYTISLKYMWRNAETPALVDFLVPQAPPSLLLVQSGDRPVEKGAR